MHSEATNPYECDKIHFPELIAMLCVLAHTCSKNKDVASKHTSLVGVWSGHNQEQELLQKKEENFGSNFLSIYLLWFVILLSNLQFSDCGN
jgi:hypothetical protein